MRVIGGSLGGRQFDSPRGHHTHPMSEKMRGAIFNMLGELRGLSILDAFSGSGALSFEAVSHGATKVVAVELDATAFTTIRSNISLLGLEDKIELHRKDVKSWSRNRRNELFDVIICDPPYDAIRYTLLIQLTQHVKPGGLIIYSLPPDHGFKLDSDEYDQLADKSYGDAQLIVYRKR